MTTQERERTTLRGLAGELRTEAEALEAAARALRLQAETLERLSGDFHVESSAPAGAAPLPELLDRKGRPLPLKRASDLVARCGRCQRCMTRAEVERAPAGSGGVTWCEGCLRITHRDRPP